MEIQSWWFHEALGTYGHNFNFSQGTDSAAAAIEVRVSFNAYSSIASSWKYHAYSSFEPLSDLQNNQRELTQKLPPCQVRKTFGRTDVRWRHNQIFSYRQVSNFYSNGGSATRAEAPLSTVSGDYWCFGVMRTVRNKEVFEIEGFDRKFLVILVLCLDSSY